MTSYVFNGRRYSDRGECIRDVIGHYGGRMDSLFEEWLYDNYGEDLWDEFVESCVDSWTEDQLAMYGVRVASDSRRSYRGSVNASARRKLQANRKAAKKPATRRRAATGARR